METDQDGHRQKIEAQLKQWASRLGMLQAKAEKAGAHARVLLLAELEELKKLDAAGRAQLAHLEGAAVAVWSDVKHELTEKWSVVSGAFETIWSRVPWAAADAPPPTPTTPSSTS